MSRKQFFFKNDVSFCIYGLGATGKSVARYFKKNRFINFKSWDDRIASKFLKNQKYKRSSREKIFSSNLDKTD